MAILCSRSFIVKVEEVEGAFGLLKGLKDLIQFIWFSLSYRYSIFWI